MHHYRPRSSSEIHAAASWLHKGRVLGIGLQPTIRWPREDVVWRFDLFHDIVTVWQFVILRSAYFVRSLLHIITALPSSHQLRYILCQVCRLRPFTF